MAELCARNLADRVREHGRRDLVRLRGHGEPDSQKGLVVELRCDVGRVAAPVSAGRALRRRFVFNENLNCLIGPRGSGKSSVLGALRYALGQNHALQELAGANAPFVGLGRGIQETNLRETNVEASSSAATASRGSCRPPSTRTRTSRRTVFDARGTDLRVQPESVREQFPVRIVSWAEMESLGRRPERQRALIERLIPRTSELIVERDRVLAAPRSNCGEVVALAGRLRSMLTSCKSLSRYVS